jgi:hypothetical protein
VQEIKSHAEAVHPELDRTVDQIRELVTSDPGRIAPVLHKGLLVSRDPGSSLALDRSHGEARNEAVKEEVEKQGDLHRSK